MKAVPLESIAEAVEEAINAGLPAEEAARRVLSDASDRVLKTLAHQYVLELATARIRANEHRTRQSALATSPGSASRKHGTTREYKRGCRCEQCVSWHEMCAESDAKNMKILVASIQKSVDIFTAELKAEWTAELLESTFGTPSGRVTWREATVADHEAHIEMAQSHAVGTMKDIAMHKRAIADITSLGASSLGDLLGAAA